MVIIIIRSFHGTANLFYCVIATTTTTTKIQLYENSKQKNVNGFILDYFSKTNYSVRFLLLSTKIKSLIVCLIHEFPNSISDLVELDD